VLKPYLDRRDVRFLGEITPEALRVLRERDRPFADLFHVLPVAEPPDADVLRILIDVRRRLEATERCRFELDALPAALDLQRRYARSLAFPGKAAGFLRQLAVKHKRGAVRRADVLAEFHAQSGVAVSLLDGRSTLKRRDVIDALAKGVVGQPAALEAAADAIAVAKARLNDPGRPLASFLFLGPTGVGKTQCAKALAGYLFGDAERLVRFDLNEYAAPGAASRLVGTFGQPEGLLTSAIRRQPFAVVLFDEVEKADPEVFDLLLQVLGEGRLTDALGRTADFTNALIVMTSNLGVREAEGNLGFRRDDAATDAVFTQAAEKFFRPEFFNRIDRVIPFRRLARDHVRGIADGLIRDVFAREGLVQRRCLLTVEPAALERLVDACYDPDLGARALKRVVERQLAAPVARELAGRVPGGFTAVHVLPGPGRLEVGVRALEPVPASPRPPLAVEDPAAWLASVRAERQRLEAAYAPLKSDAPVTAKLDARQERYYRLRAQAERVRELERELGDALRDRRAAAPSLRKPDAARTPGVVRLGFDASKMILREMAAARDINEYLNEVALPAGAAGPLDARLAALADQLALLRLMVESALAGETDSVLLWLRARPGEFAATVAWMTDFYEASLSPWAVELEWLDDLVRANPSSGVYRVHGPHARALVAGEAGTHLFCPRGAPVLPLAVEVLPSAETLRARLDARAAWLAALAAGTATAADDPFAFGPVVRVYEAGPAARAGEYGRVVDFRSGLVGDGVNGAEFFRAGLPASVCGSLPSSFGEPCQ
jgi:DNA polymerase III delta prime subunit